MTLIEEHKVVRPLDELLPEALEGTPSGVRLDCRIYFREDSGDAHLRSEVVLQDPDTGKGVHDSSRSLPLDSPQAVKWYLGLIVDRAFPLALERRTKTRD